MEGLKANLTKQVFQNTNPRHFLDSQDFNRDELAGIFSFADELRAGATEESIRTGRDTFFSPDHRTLHSDKRITIASTQPSTRTIESFKTAANILGIADNAITDPGIMSMVKGESLSDTLLTFQQNSDIIAMRHYDAPSVIEAIKKLNIPYVSGGHGNGTQAESCHPTQSLLDVYTLQRTFGELDNLDIAFLGDLKFGRTINSLARMMAMYDNLHLHLCPTKGLEFNEHDMEFIKASGIGYTEYDNVLDIPHWVNVLYLTRIQEEYMPKGMNKEQYLKDIEPVRMNQAKLNRFSNDTIVLHPYPRNIDFEMDESMDNDPRFLPNEQMYNGVFARAAMFNEILK